MRASFNANPDADRIIIVLSSLSLTLLPWEANQLSIQLVVAFNFYQIGLCTGHGRSTKHSNMPSRDNARFKVI